MPPTPSDSMLKNPEQFKHSSLGSTHQPFRRKGENELKSLAAKKINKDRGDALVSNGNKCRVCKSEYEKHKLNQGVNWIINRLQKIVQTITIKKGVRDCSKYPTKTSVILRTAVGGGNASFVGLNRCLNSTVCPRCSAIRGVQRAVQIDSVAKPIMAAGGSGAMLTLTIPHYRKDDFKWLNKSINKCWHSLMRQKFGKHVANFNLSRQPLWVRSWDHTWSPNGNNIHLHSLIMFERNPTDDEFSALFAECIDAWGKLVEKVLNRKASPEAMTFKRVYDAGGVAKYNNKISSVAFEIASGGLTKTQKKTSFNIWELIWSIQEEKDPEKKKVLIKKFQMFEAQTHKLRTISFSKTYKERIPKEGEDGDLEEEKPETVDVLKIRTDLFKHIRKMEDTLNLLDLYNSYSTGDESAKPIVKMVEDICNKFSEESNNFDEPAMMADWGFISFRLSSWAFYKSRPEYYNQPYDLLISGGG